MRITAAFAFLLLLGACAAAPEAENKSVKEMDNAIKEASYMPVHKKVILGGKTLKSDSKNARYEQKSMPKKVRLTPSEPSLEPAVTKPVAKKEIKKISVIKKETAPAAPSVAYQVATVLFNNGSAAVDSSYNAELRKIARLVKAKKAHVTVYGFASSRTKNTDIVTHKLANFNISLKRAQNVAKALQNYGVKENMIAIEALSDTMPLYQEVMPEGERLNRRAEIYISY